MMRAVIIALAGLMLAGCATKGPASIAGGECQIFERPAYEVRGQKPYDQDWIDSNIEGGVGGCGWARPAPRPAEIDAMPATAVKIAPVPKKKRNLVRRVKERVSSWTRQAPVAAVPPLPAQQPPEQLSVPPATVAVAPEPPAAAAPPSVVARPRNPVDELLHLGSRP